MVVLRRVGGVVLIVVTFLAGQALLRTSPGENERAAPFFVPGHAFQPTTVDGLLVTVQGLRGAAKLHPAEGPALTAKGVWVLVRLELMATSHTTTAAYLALADRHGHTYRPSTRLAQGLTEGSPKLQPGLPVNGEVAYEVPREFLTELSLRAAEHYDEALGLRSRAVTDIAIQVSPADADRWAAEPDPAVLAVTQVVA